MSRRKVSTIVLGLAVAAGTVLPAVPASADSQGDYHARGVNIRKASNTKAWSHGHGNLGDGITVKCLVGKGQSINGGSIWGNHKNKRTKVEGYSSAWYFHYYLSTGTPRMYANASTCPPVVNV